MISIIVFVPSYMCAANVVVAVPIDKELLQEDIKSFIADSGYKAVCPDVMHR